MTSPTKKITFHPPTGAVPEGTGVGDTFDLVCSFKLEAGGTVCLTQMGEHKLAGYGAKDGDGDKPRPTYRDEAQAMINTQPGTGGGGGGY